MFIQWIILETNLITLLVLFLILIFTTSSAAVENRYGRMRHENGSVPRTVLPRSPKYMGMQCLFIYLVCGEAFLLFFFSLSVLFLVFYSSLFFLSSLIQWVFNSVAIEKLKLLERLVCYVYSASNFEKNVYILGGTIGIHCIWNESFFRVTSSLCSYYMLWFFKH